MRYIPKDYELLELKQGGIPVLGTQRGVKTKQNLKAKLAVLNEALNPYVVADPGAHFFKEVLIPKLVLTNFTSIYVENVVIGDLVVRRANQVELFDSYINNISILEGDHVNNLWLDTCEVYADLSMFKASANKVSVNSSYVRNIQLINSKFKNLDFRAVETSDLTIYGSRVNQRVSLYNISTKHINAGRQCNIEFDFK